jgi:tRNA pseudouridine38-40 synthase
MLRNLMLTIAYDGADFHGWQEQPNLRTVQEVLTTALRRALRHQIVLIGSSRTDAGVHAAGHVANVYTTNPMSCDNVYRSVGSRLPKDLTLIYVEEVPLTFHATRSAVAKLYRYRIHNTGSRPCEQQNQRFVYHFWHRLDLDRMREAAKAWIGTHDFTALASTGNVRENNIRTITAIQICRIGPEVQIDVEGEGFLYKQVRNMVGTLVEIGRGQREVGDARKIIKSRDRRQAGPTAPARGLCLRWVRYDLPRLAKPSPQMLERAAAAEPPKGAQRAYVDHLPRSTAPLPPGIDTDEEPPA